MKDISSYHDSQFNLVRSEAHHFNTDNLGLDVAPLESIALITPNYARKLREHFGVTWSGGYNSVDNTVVVIQEPCPLRPHTEGICNGAAVVHEIAHSGTATVAEHTFYNEALAGVAEHEYLRWLGQEGWHRPATDFMLQRAGVELWIPRDMRYLDERDAVDVPVSGPRAHTSQGLVATLGILHASLASGFTNGDLLRVSSRNGYAQFAAMRWSLNALKMGLAKEVESLPTTSDGITQATAIIQAEAVRQDLLRVNSPSRP